MLSNNLSTGIRLKKSCNISVQFKWMASKLPDKQFSFKLMGAYHIVLLVQCMRPAKHQIEQFFMVCVQNFSESSRILIPLCQLTNKKILFCNDMNRTSMH